MYLKLQPSTPDPDPALCLSKTPSTYTAHRLHLLSFSPRLECNLRKDGGFCLVSSMYISPASWIACGTKITPYMFVEWMKKCWLKPEPGLKLKCLLCFHQCFQTTLKVSLYEKGVLSSNLGNTSLNKMTFFVIGRFILNSSFPICMTSEYISSIPLIAQETSLPLHILWLIYLLFYYM